MASSLPNPTDLTIATRLPPQHARTFSRSKSPERSPARKAQFAARELDPLLQSLSPDATLDALQKTNTIVGNRVEQTALAKSISDASESERKLGIRAAIAAKNLREWTEEVSAWPWPAREDRPWGAGFIPPIGKGDDSITHWGSLPKTTVEQYEDRLDEIWDAIETLGMDDLKDYVFSFHNPRAPSTGSPKSYPSSYGRMRDFTALITATVIQSLPVQANLLILLDSWSIRLAVLREVPELLSRLDRVKLGLSEINEIIQDPKTSCRLTKSELETAKVMFGNKVSNLGKRVDILLDQLEGQEDSLPQPWLDQLDDIENKYAEWVARAEQVVLKNQMSRHDSQITTTSSDTMIASDPSSTPTHVSDKIVIDGVEDARTLTPASSPSRGMSTVKRKPLLEVNPNSQADQKHRRGISEVSAAESTFSGYSLENAEIIDAVETKVMPSPRISVIDHQFSPNKNVIPWMRGGTNISLSPPRPSVLLQRASTASIEVIPKSHIKEVTLRRSASHDLLSSSRQSSRSTLRMELPPPATSSAVMPPQNTDLGFVPLVELPGTLTPLAASPSPSLKVDPLSLRGKELDKSILDQRPVVPRRSSKRLSMPLLESSKRPFTPPKQEVNSDKTAVVGEIFELPAAPPKEPQRQATFDDRLKSILASMPTKIRLTDDSDSGISSGATSRSSSRASSPVQGLKLSPVKDSKSGRHQSTSGIRVYNLSKTGKLRDAPPVKLFVRAVGEHGERVMVRVGGGWADLAEYLREYSLHHGGRSLTERGLEVKGYPGGNSAKLLSSPTLIPSSQRGSPHARPLSQQSRHDPTFDFGLSEQGEGVNTGTHKSSLSLDSLDRTRSNPERPPPVPLIPSSHTPNANSRGASPRTTPTPRSQTPANTSRPTSRISVHSATNMPSPNHYTPLGAAGPVHNSRRSTTYSYTLTPRNEAWVNGMVNQARAVSGSSQTHSPQISSTSVHVGNRHSTTITTSPIITTTTVTSRVRCPNSAGRNSATRRFSNIISPTTPTPGAPPRVLTKERPSVRPVAHTSPDGSDMSRMSSGSSGSYATADTNVSKTKKLDGEGRRRSMMSFGDVGGIRRVFLRKKSDKSDD